jgi:hypothetical protein
VRGQGGGARWKGKGEGIQGKEVGGKGKDAGVAAGGKREWGRLFNQHSKKGYARLAINQVPKCNAVPGILGFQHNKLGTEHNNVFRLETLNPAQHQKRP